MRLWSIHPKYLDTKGLVALWREGLLALAVLRGQTKGYRHHPQLIRFKMTGDPIRAISHYLVIIFQEARSRGFQFNVKKIPVATDMVKTNMIVTTGQLQYEWDHLKSKLVMRDVDKLNELRTIINPDPHPIFRVVFGPVENWEKSRKYLLH